MAKFTVTVTVLLFMLAFSKPENEIIADNLPALSADPDSTNPTLPGPDLTSSDEVTIPVNFVNFHPINRHFPRRPLTTAPFHHRPCHHELLGRGLQIPYGNDMIFSDQQKTSDTDRSSDGVVVADIPTITMLEKTKYHPGEVEAEEDGSMKITVKLMKRKEEGEGEGERENMLRRKIRKYLNHLV